jgi:hypothetical protein
MKPITSWLTEHPASVGESYVRHLARAWSFSFSMIGAGVCGLVHGLLPFLFVRTASAAVARLHDRMTVNRGARVAAVPAAQSAPRTF